MNAYRKSLSCGWNETE